MNENNLLIYEPLNSDSVVSFFTSLGQKHNKIFVLVDENTNEYCWPLLVYQFEALKEAEILLLPEGEEQKSIEIAVQLWEILTQYKATRNDLIINLGGGVITDLGGFIASTYKRGIDFINIPTTLLGMVDAAIGGKNGINFQALKNQIGCFNAPKATIISSEFLNTLPQEELLSGFAEMLKHGLIADKTHYENLISNNLPNSESQETIAQSAKIKSTIVEEDFKESGKRKLLNYGHTVGHAIESLSHAMSKPIPHGYCVAYGICIENEIANRLEILDAEVSSQINQKIASFFPAIDNSLLEPEAIYEVMTQDKKSTNGNITMALIKEIGKGVIVENIEKEVILEAINKFKNANEAGL